MSPFKQNLANIFIAISIIMGVAVIGIANVRTMEKNLLSILCSVVAALFSSGLTMRLLPRTEEKEKEYFAALYRDHISPSIAQSLDKIITPKSLALVESATREMTNANFDFLKKTLLPELCKFCSNQKIACVKDKDTYRISVDLLNEYDPDEIRIVMAAGEFKLTDKSARRWNKILSDHVSSKESSLKRVIVVSSKSADLIKDDIVWIRKFLKQYEGVPNCDMFCEIDTLNVSVGTMINVGQTPKNAALLFGFVVNRRLHNIFYVTEQFGDNTFCRSINGWFDARYNLGKPKFKVMEDGRIDSNTVAKLEAQLYEAS